MIRYCCNIRQDLYYLEHFAPALQKEICTHFSVYNTLVFITHS